MKPTGKYSQQRIFLLTLQTRPHIFYILPRAGESPMAQQHHLYTEQLVMGQAETFPMYKPYSCGQQMDSNSTYLVWKSGRQQVFPRSVFRSPSSASLIAYISAWSCSPSGHDNKGHQFFPFQIKRSIVDEEITL